MSASGNVIRATWVPLLRFWTVECKLCDFSIGVTQSRPHDIAWLHAGMSQHMDALVAVETP